MFIFTLLDELHTEESFRKKLRIYSAAYRDVFFTKRFLAAWEEEGVSFIGEQRINICARTKEVRGSIQIFFESPVKIDRGREADGVGNLLVAHVGREE